MRWWWRGAAVVGVVAGCAVTEPMSDKLAIVPQVEGMNAACKVVLKALTNGDTAALGQAVTPDFRCPGVPDLTGPAAAAAMVTAGRAPFTEVLGGHFKVRALLDSEGDRVNARCERRLRGVLRNGNRWEEIARVQAAFRKTDAGWRLAECHDLDHTVVEGPPPTRFEDWTAASGIVHTFRENGSRGPGFFPGEHDGGACAAVDVDGDGDLDCWLGDGTGPHLWLNDGAGHFTDVTAQTGLQPITEGSCRGLCCVDFDGDGLRDLFVAVSAGPNVFYRGAPGLRFREATAEAGLADSGRFSTSVAAADLDGDGDLDCYVCNYGDGRHTPVDRLARNAEPNRCFRNDGHGRFTDVSAASGLDDTGYSLSVAFADVDHDGDVDCFVANDFAFNRFFRNRGDGTFEDATDICGKDDAGTSMGVTWADLDGDGDLDCYVSNMYSSTGQWIFDDPDYPIGGVAGFLFRDRVLEVMHKLAAGNSLLRNDGDHFTLLVGETGAANAGWAWSAPALDADGDGRTDLFVVNGMITGPDPTDT